MGFGWLGEEGMKSIVRARMIEGANNGCVGFQEFSGQLHTTT